MRNTGSVLSQADAQHSTTNLAAELRGIFELLDDTKAPPLRKEAEAANQSAWSVASGLLVAEGAARLQ